MPKNRKNVYMLVDGNALIHRGFHAIPGLTNKNGEPTGAVYGFTLILLKAIKDVKPTHIAVSFDLKGPTFRHKMYDGYKAQRVAAPQDLYDQIPRVKEVVGCLNIPVFVKEGFEADDVLGTLSLRLHETDPEAEIIIATGDLDTLQLVNHNTKVYTMRKGIADTALYDEKAVRERYGLNPNQMVDYKALRGDPSDNIPGVKGIGEKTASQLIQQFGSLQSLYAGIDNGSAARLIKSRTFDLLKADKDMAFQSYELSKIVCSVPIETEVARYVFDRPHQLRTARLFQELEFKSLLDKLPKPEAVGEDDAGVAVSRTAAAVKQRYTLIDSAEGLRRMLDEIKTVGQLAVDTETTSLHPVDAQLLGVSLSAEDGVSYYVPAPFINSEFANVLVDRGIKKIGHNIKYDMAVLKNSQYGLSPLFFDTMIASFLLNPSGRQHNLDSLAFNELGYQMQPIEDLIGKGKNQISMRDVPLEKVSWYSCEDADMTLRLKKELEPRLKKEKLDKIFWDIEMPLVEVLGSMEQNGILLDSKFLNKLSGSVEVDIKNLESDIYRLTGETFNINSPKQLKEVLFDRLQLQSEGLKKTKTGLSTAADQLEKMLGQHPVIEKLLEYRELSKLQSTYLLALPTLVNKKTGRIHTSYNQTIAATGRLSSTDPNLQNIPVRGEGIGSEIRKAFVAEKGFVFLSLDYSQIELRVAAHVAKDKKMTEVFKKGDDIHLKTAMEIFGVTKENVTPDMRRGAKTINFGILYGVSSFGLSERVKEMSRYDAKQFIEKYFEAYPDIEKYIESIKLQVNEEAFVRNELGRIRKFPEIKSSQFFVRAAAERAAINFPIQSLAADIIKLAMIGIFKEIKNFQSEIKMLLQVHDELLFEVRADRVDFWLSRIKPCMEQALTLSVPVEVEAKQGQNWGEMEPVVVYQKL